MNQDDKGVPSAPDQNSSKETPLHETPAFREYLARTSYSGDEGLEPIRPGWRREKMVPSPLDGTMISTVTPLSDAQLIWLVRCLDFNEKARLDHFWKQIVEAPLQPAVDALKELKERPKRLMKRVGRHKTSLGDNPLEMELTRLLIHRIFDLSLEGLGLAPEPKHRHAAQIANHILAGLCQPHLFEAGPLKDYIKVPVETLLVHLVKSGTRRQQKAIMNSGGRRVLLILRRAVQSTLEMGFGKNRSRAFSITHGVVEAIGIHLSERSLRRILARRTLFRVLPDLIHRNAP